eukprot:gb/GECG01007417.1/.p1 GENE.gb/GECG01007417.1/~~gb/GECG01007417.1/.p1  ORF type:complete len:138 (+),score=7.62 gb/GECG01007417.1/:1-414(+)
MSSACLSYTAYASLPILLSEYFLSGFLVQDFLLCSTAFSWVVDLARHRSRNLETVTMMIALWKQADMADTDINTSNFVSGRTILIILVWQYQHICRSIYCTDRGKSSALEGNDLRVHRPYNGACCRGAKSRRARCTK